MTTFVLMTLCISTIALGAGLVIAGVTKWLADIQDMIERADYE